MLGQDISIDIGNDATLTERAVQLVGIITVLALAPSILVMVTSFTLGPGAHQEETIATGMGAPTPAGVTIGARYG